MRAALWSLPVTVVVAADAARNTLGGAVEVAAHLPGQAGAALLESARVAFSHGLNLVAAIGATSMALAAAVAALRLRQVTAAPPSATRNQ